MNWQVEYALKNLRHASGVTSADHAGGDAIRIRVPEQPDVVAVISDTYTMSLEDAMQYHQAWPDMSFLCGYRKDCVWEGKAIAYLEANAIGWGSIGTLGTAVSHGNVRSAGHKSYAFAYRIIRQLRYVSDLYREFDRIFSLKLLSGRSIRIAMILEYEPTADSVRTIRERFGPVDIVWSINPNGFPTPSAIEAGRQLGCEVLKWEGMRSILQKG